MAVIAGQQHGPVRFVPVQRRVQALFLAQGALQAGQIGLLPASGGPPAALVEINQPALAGIIEQDVVNIEVGVINAGGVKAADHGADLLPLVCGQRSGLQYCKQVSR